MAAASVKEMRSITLCFVHKEGVAVALKGALPAFGYAHLGGVKDGDMYKNDQDGNYITVTEIEVDGLRYTGMVIGTPSAFHATPEDFIETWPKQITLNEAISTVAGTQPGRFARTHSETAAGTDLFGANTSYVDVAKKIRGGT